jgi:hypothetical protein
VQRDMARKVRHQQNHVPGRVRFDYVQGEQCDLRRPSSTHPSPAWRAGSLRRGPGAPGQENLAKPVELLVTGASGNPHVTHITYRVIK